MYTYIARIGFINGHYSKIILLIGLLILELENFKILYLY